MRSSLGGPIPFITRLCGGLLLALCPALVSGEGPVTPVAGWEASTRFVVGRTDQGQPLTAVTENSLFHESLPRPDRIVFVTIPEQADGTALQSQLEQVASLRKLMQKTQRQTLGFVCVPLPAGASFPPTGTGYNTAGQRTATAIWRSLAWLGVDLVIEFRPAETEAWSKDSLAQAVKTQKIMDYGSVAAAQLPASMLSVPAARWSAEQWANSGLEHYVTGKMELPESSVHTQCEQRLTRTPQVVAQQLSQVYGHDLKKVMYQPALALIARLQLAEMTGDKETLPEIAKILEPYLEKSSAKVDGNGSVVSGHLVFADWALRTRDPRAVELVRQAANVGFDSKGQPLVAMPSHNEMSDAVFMGCPILSSAARLTGETKYLDELSRHFLHMRKLCLRSDGLYRHSPLCEAAWGRGNGFPMLGLALTLTDLQEIQEDMAASPELKSQAKKLFDTLLAQFQHLAGALLPHQDVTGMWRQIIDEPSAYRELTASCMIGVALQRGLRNGWLQQNRFQQPADRAWEAVKLRVGSDGHLLDVCAGTGKQKSLQDYFDRMAVLGVDERGGAMALLFAVERSHEMTR